MTQNSMKIENYKPVPLRTCSASGLKIIIRVFVALLVVCIPILTRGASLYFTVPRDVVFVGEDFEVSLMLDTEGESVNAIEGTVLFPSETLVLDGIETGASVIDLWIVSPREDADEVSFLGVVPGGFVGVREPGTQRLLPGIIATLLVKAEQAGTAEFSVQDAQVLKHDGVGTPLPVIAKSKKITVTENLALEAKDEKRKITDITPPEPFEIMFVRDAALYEGKLTAIFAAQDNESGVAYYDVAERRGEKTKNYAELAWSRAESPYLLKDQGRWNRVYMRAVDNAGNIRVVSASPAPLLLFLVDNFALVLTTLGIITMLLLIIYFKRK